MLEFLSMLTIIDDANDSFRLDISEFVNASSSKRTIYKLVFRNNQFDVPHPKIYLLGQYFSDRLTILPHLRTFNIDADISIEMKNFLTLIFRDEIKNQEFEVNDLSEFQDELYNIGEKFNNLKFMKPHLKNLTKDTDNLHQRYIYNKCIKKSRLPAFIGKISKNNKPINLEKFGSYKYDFIQDLVLYANSSGNQNSRTKNIDNSRYDMILVAVTEQPILSFLLNNVDFSMLSYANLIKFQQYVEKQFKDDELYKNVAKVLFDSILNSLKIPGNLIVANGLVKLMINGREVDAQLFYNTPQLPKGQRVTIELIDDRIILPKFYVVRLIRENATEDKITKSWIFKGKDANNYSHVLENVENLEIDQSVIVKREINTDVWCSSFEFTLRNYENDYIAMLDVIGELDHSPSDEVDEEDEEEE